jgi:diaminopimelate decarboxylase
MPNKFQTQAERKRASHALAGGASAFGGLLYCWLNLWAHDKAMPPLAEGDFIAFLNAGGYGGAMHSNHCMRADFREIHV